MFTLKLPAPSPKYLHPPSRLDQPLAQEVKIPPRVLMVRDTATQTRISSFGLTPYQTRRARVWKSIGQSSARVWHVPAYFLCLWLCQSGHLLKPRPNKSLAIQVLCPQPHPSTHAHSPSHTSYTTKMSKQPSATRQNTRYDPYQSSDRPCRRPGLRPRRNRAEAHHSQPSGNVCQPHSESHQSSRGHDLPQLPGKHASQPNGFAQAIDMLLAASDVSAFLNSFLESPPFHAHTESRSLIGECR